MRYTVGVDIGTFETKGVLVNELGKVEASTLPNSFTRTPFVSNVPISTPTVYLMFAPNLGLN